MEKNTIIMRNLCDVLMQNNALPVNAKIEESIKNFRDLLQPELRKQFNDILDAINNADSEYVYDAFSMGYYSGIIFKNSHYLL